MRADEQRTRSDAAISRREMLGLIGAAGLTAVAGCGGDGSSADAGVPTPTPAATPAPTPSPDEVACVLTPEQIEGPYFLDERLNRSDIRSDAATGVGSPGAPLLLRLGVYAVGTTCTPLTGAVVDVWHADAQGSYSGFAGAEDETYLRGYQVVDEQGEVEFRTIFPGWYPGRAIHVHFKVRWFDAAGGVTWQRTSQLYFRDELADSVLQSDPYAARGPRDTRNDDDVIFADGGPELLLAAAPNEAEGGIGAVHVIGIAPP